MCEVTALSSRELAIEKREAQKRRNRQKNLARIGGTIRESLPRASPARRAKM